MNKYTNLYAKMYADPIFHLNAKPAPKVQEKYAVKRVALGARTWLGSLGLIRFTPSLGIIDASGVRPERATLFPRIEDAVAAVSCRNAANPTYADDKFAIVKVLITTTPGTKTVRTAKEGERVSKWAIGEAAGWLLMNAPSPHNWTLVLAEARMFDTRAQAARFAVSGDLPDKEAVWNVSIVGLVESTTPDSVKYDVVEL